MRVSTFYFLIICLALISIAIGCKRRLSQSEIKDNLEKAMTAYLMNEQQRDSTHFRFSIEDVNYFDAKDFYECEFKVRLFREQGGDTTGIIKGSVSKDFTAVNKKW